MEFPRSCCWTVPQSSINHIACVSPEMTPFNSTTWDSLEVYLVLSLLSTLPRAFLMSLVNKFWGSSNVSVVGMQSPSRTACHKQLGWLVKLDSATHRINLLEIYPVDSGKHYPPFEQLGPGAYDSVSQYSGWENCNSDNNNNIACECV